MTHKRFLWPAMATLLALALLVAACGPAATPTAEPTPTRPLRPTFTPTPVSTDTPTPVPPTDTPVPTDTPTPLPTDTPTPVKPMAVAGGTGQVNLRSGPGEVYDQIGQVASGAELEIIAKNAASDWYQVCCVDGQPGWIVSRLVQEVKGDAAAIPVASSIPAPPTATPRPTPRPIVVQPTRPPAPPAQPTQPPAPPAPTYKFVKLYNEPRPNTNPIVSFFGALFNSAQDLSKPVTGYKLVVVSPTGETQQTDFTTPFLNGDPGLASVFRYNAKIEFFGGPEGVYRAYVADPGGNQVSEAWENTVSGDTRTFLVRWKEP